MRAFFQGFGAVMGAIDLFTKHGRLRRLAILPSLVSVALLTLLAWLSFRYGPRLLDLIWHTAPDATGWQSKLLGAAHGLTQFLVVVFLLFLSGAVFFFGSRLVAEPFIDLLSEGAEVAAGHEPTGRKFTFGRLMKDLGLVLVDILIDVPLFFACHAVNLVIGLVPVIGPPVQVVCAWLINATFSAMEMSAVGMARRGVRGWGRWQVAKANQTRILGLGAGVVLLLMVPLAQLVTLPVAVVAGTLVVIELERDNRLRPPARTAAEAEA